MEFDVYGTVFMHGKLWMADLLMLVQRDMKGFSVVIGQGLFFSFLLIEWIIGPSQIYL